MAFLFSLLFPVISKWDCFVENHVLRWRCFIHDIVPFSLELKWASCFGLGHFKLRARSWNGHWVGVEYLIKLLRRKLSGWGVFKKTVVLANRNVNVFCGRDPVKGSFYFSFTFLRARATFAFGVISALHLINKTLFVIDHFVCFDDVSTFKPDFISRWKSKKLLRWVVAKIFSFN